MNIDEIKAQLAAITPGEWRENINEDGIVEIWSSNYNICEIGDMEYTDAIDHQNAEFIAAAPSIVRELLAEVERLNQYAHIPPIEVGQSVQLLETVFRHGKPQFAAGTIGIVRKALLTGINDDFTEEFEYHVDFGGYVKEVSQSIIKVYEGVQHDAQDRAKGG